MRTLTNSPVLGTVAQCPKTSVNKVSKSSQYTYLGGGIITSKKAGGQFLGRSYPLPPPTHRGVSELA